MPTGTGNWVSLVKAVWPASQWAPLNLKIFYYSNSAQTRNFKKKTFHCPKILNFCMMLDLNILNNVLNWVNFRISREFML
jgi:hypothetical protein